MARVCLSFRKAASQEDSDGFSATAAEVNVRTSVSSSSVNSLGSSSPLPLHAHRGPLSPRHPDCSLLPLRVSPNAPLCSNWQISSDAQAEGVSLP